jgi:hypothetical protein
LVVGSSTTPASKIIEVSNEDFGYLVNGTYDLYIIGGIQYRDMFSPKIKPYETTYCFVTNPVGMPFGECSFAPPYFGNSIK